MQSSSRSLFGTLSLILVALLATALLGAVILAARTPATGDVTETPTPVMATPPPIPTMVAPFQGLPIGAIMTAEQVGDIPPDTRVMWSTFMPTDQGFLYTITTLDGSLTAEAYDTQLKFAPDYDPLQPLPAPVYQDSVYWSRCYVLTLIEDIPLLEPRSDIPFLPAGSRVAVSSYESMPRYVEGRGYLYHYTVVMQPPDGTDPSPDAPVIAGTAYESQLAPAPDVQILEGAPTATSPFIEIGMGALFVTTEQVGDIPPGASVRISSGYYGCNMWYYQIVTADEAMAVWAREDQIAYAEGVTPGAPTPMIAISDATITPTRLPQVFAYTTGDPLTYLYRQPDPDEPPEAELGIDTQLVVIAVSAEGDWYLVGWPASPAGTLWVQTSAIRIDGDPGLIPNINSAPEFVYARTVADPTILRSGPGLEYDMVAELKPDHELQIIGRWWVYDWFLVRWADSPTGDAWVHGAMINIEGDATLIPAVEPPPLPTPTPYPTP